MQSTLSPDTQAVLLLCGHFAPRETASPLELREYNRLGEALRERGLTPASLLERGTVDALDWMPLKLERARVARLLERGAAMALAVERWTSAGLWLVSRADEHYPNRLRSHLGRSAPGILFGVGDPAALDCGGLAIVGSRDIDEEGERFTAAVAGQCAREGLQVVSGGARGVDEIALASAFEEGGSVVVALPEGLGKASLAAKYREGLREERLVLVSPYAPHAPFSVGNAMGRNRLIYALADAAVVVSSALRSGGTWAGAEEELNRDRPRRVFVRRAPIEGNEALLTLGALPFPGEPWDVGLRAILDSSVTEPPAAAPEAGSSSMAQESSRPPADYEAFVTQLLTLLVAPRTAAEITEAVELPKSRVAKWLKQAIDEKRITKGGRPMKYRRTETGAPAVEQSSLFG